MAYEARLELRCCRVARAAGCVPVKLGGYEVSLPDRMILLPHGRVWLVEFKGPKGYNSPGQNHRFTELARLGHPVTIVRSPQEFDAALTRVLA